MIVVAIIGILASIALPAYQDYTTRARVSEGLVIASAGKEIVSENHYNDPSTAAHCSDGTFGMIVGHSTITCEDASGVLTITMDATAANVILTLSPSFSTAGIEWLCEVTNAANNKYVPSECRI